MTSDSDSPSYTIDTNNEQQTVFDIDDMRIKRHFDKYIEYISRKRMLFSFLNHLMKFILDSFKLFWKLREPTSERHWGIFIRYEMIWICFHKLHIYLDMIVDEAPVSINDSNSGTYMHTQVSAAIIFVY